MIKKFYLFSLFYSSWVYFFLFHLHHHLPEKDLIRIIILPKISKPLGFSFGLSAAISMGDFGVIALFSDPDSSTLPMTIYRFMASYRVNEAASGALLLLILTFGIFSLFDYVGRKNVKN